jgi:DNA-binding LytR/AlgR family response regulator
MPKKILVIEDEKGLCDNIRILLEAEKYEVFLAENGKEGIAKANIIRPDLIICDIMMPEVNGYEVIKQLQSQTNALTMPFIFLTAKIEQSDLRTGMNLGADDYIFKPFDSNDLLKTIATRLNKHENIKAFFKKETEEKKKYNLNDKIAFKIGDHSEFIPVDSIIYISADRQYTNIFTGNNKRFILKRAISKWEQILPGNYFVRVHRSTLINLNHVNKIQRIENNSYRIHLNNSGIMLEVSRRFYKNLKIMQ